MFDLSQLTQVLQPLLPFAQVWEGVSGTDFQLNPENSQFIFKVHYVQLGSYQMFVNLGLLSAAQLPAFQAAAKAAIVNMLNQCVNDILLKHPELLQQVGLSPFALHRSACRIRNQRAKHKTCVLASGLNDSF